MMEFAEDCSVFRCTECGELIVITEGELAPDMCLYCAGERVPERTKDRIIEDVIKFFSEIDNILSISSKGSDQMQGTGSMKTGSMNTGSMNTGYWKPLSINRIMAYK